MFAKIVMLQLLNSISFAEEQPFLDLKKVIRGALDVVAAVPTSAPANHSFGGAAGLSGIQGIDPVVREKLSRIFHIPPDFLHRLAAQTGYIDYEPTTTIKPPSSYRSRSQVRTPPIISDTTGSAFIQENPIENTFNLANDFSAMGIQQKNFATLQQAANNLPQQQAVVFQPVLKDGHLYYQPFGALSEASEPQMIVYDGRVYMATPAKSEISNPDVMISASTTQNQHETPLKKMKEKNPLITSENVKQMRNRRIYAEYVKAAENAQIQAAKLQKPIVPDTSANEIPGIEKNPLMQTLTPSSKLYNLQKFDNYYKPYTIGLGKNVLNNDGNSVQNDVVKEDQQRELFEIQITPSQMPYHQSITTILTTAKPTYKPIKPGNSPFRQLPINQMKANLESVGKSYELEKEHAAIDRSNETTIDDQFSPQKNDDKNIRIKEKSKQMQRILALRRKMAVDRKKFAERKRLLSSMKRKVNKVENTNKKKFLHHCYNIRSFARQFGVLDIKQYAISNCAFIENYYSDIKCNEVELFIDRCLEFFRENKFFIH